MILFAANSKFADAARLAPFPANDSYKNNGTAPTRAASKTREIAADGQTYKANLILAVLLLKRNKR